MIRKRVLLILKRGSMVRQLAQALKREKQYAVTTAHAKDRMVSRLKGTQPDVIVADPGMLSGIVDEFSAAVHRARARHPVLVIGLCRSESEQLACGGLHTCIDYFMIGPLEIPSLLQIIRVLLQ